MSLAANVESGSRPRVLVVDDEELVCKAVRRVLAAASDVTVARSAAEALSLLGDGGPYDLVLCDLMMPGMTGYELHREVAGRDAAAAARFVFLTGGAFTAEAQQYLEATGARRVGKPFDAAVLRALAASSAAR